LINSENGEIVGF